MKKKKEISATIEIPQEITFNLDKGILILNGKKGELKRDFLDPKIKLEKQENKIKISGLKSTQREKKKVNTCAAVIKNMVKGVTEGHKYLLKICSGHFPMNVSVNKDQLVIKNFFGEKTPRTLNIKQGTSIKVENELVTIEGIDKDICGEMASDIEQLTKRSNFDPRIFQDGIYIINKDGKEIK